MCADFRDRLSTFLDDHAKDYDAVLTTARLPRCGAAGRTARPVWPKRGAR